MRISTTIVFVYRKSDKDSCSVIEVYWQPRKNMASAEQISLYLYISISGILGSWDPPPPSPTARAVLFNEPTPATCPHILCNSSWLMNVGCQMESKIAKRKWRDEGESWDSLSPESTSIFVSSLFEGDGCGDRWISSFVCSSSLSLSLSLPPLRPAVESLRERNA